MHIHSCCHRYKSSEAFDQAHEVARKLKSAFQRPKYASSLHSSLEMLGLEVSTHNFTTKWPYGNRYSSTCTNMHAILRSPRGDGKEAILLVTPITFQPFWKGMQTCMLMMSGAGALSVVGFGVLPCKQLVVTMPGLVCNSSSSSCFAPKQHGLGVALHTA